MEKIGIIGSGYVGLVTGACFSKFGHHIIFNDINQKMLKGLEKGIVPIHEPGLNNLLKDGFKKGLIETSTDKKYVTENSNIIVLSLPTPPKKDGNADLRYLRKVVKEIAQMMNSPKIFVNKSTAPVGTTRLIREIVRRYYQGNFEVMAMPEFLLESKAVETFIHGDRQVLGFESNISQDNKQRIIDLFEGFDSEIVVTDCKTAEFSKYANNAFLALSISFINSLSNVAEKLNIDIKDISKIMRLDKRIGKHAWLEAGPGFGGMCFPKDVLCIVGISDRFGYTNNLLQASYDINFRQRLIIAEKVINFIQEINKPRISILGLAFKKNTSDVRDSQSKTVIEELIKKGYTNIIVYDPLAMADFKQYQLEIDYADNPEQAVKNSDCLVIMTEWDVFADMDLNKTKKEMNTPNIVDGRNLLDKEMAKKLGFQYIGMGRK